MLQKKFSVGSEDKFIIIEIVIKGKFKIFLGLPLVYDINFCNNIFNIKQFKLFITILQFAMNINLNTITSKNIYFSSKKINESSNEEHYKNKTFSKSIMKKALPYTLAGILLYGGMHSCSETYSGKDNFDNVKVEYFNVSKEAKDSTLAPLLNLKSKLTPENDFLSGIEIDITGSYQDLDDGNSFRVHLKSEYDTSTDKGGSFYSDKNLPRRIVIQESGHTTDKIFNLIRDKKYTAIHALRQSLMHEVGHQFDQFFGHNHNAEFAKEWDEIMLRREKSEYMTPYDLPADSVGLISKLYYNMKSGLSDKPDFQNAILKDLKHIAKLKQEHPEKLAGNIDYYLGIIDIGKEITPHIVDLADMTRSEVYANLFSYAVGEDEGEKDYFIENFQNSYKIVRRDIIDCLGANVVK